MAIITFGVYLGIQWWASNGVDGSGYIAQRMFAAKNERHTLLATLWFNIAHYTLRPWPWILVALVAMVVYPGLGDPEHVNPALHDAEAGYPMLMLDYLPVGLLGLMLTAFLAAFMSTIDTHLNWGASYLVNDFYKRFFKPEATPEHYVAISRLFVILIMLIAGATSFFMNSIAGAWKFLIALNAGIGLVQILAMVLVANQRMVRNFSDVCSTDRFDCCLFLTTNERRIRTPNVNYRADFYCSLDSCYVLNRTCFD